jgi:hypothetical protein
MPKPKILMKIESFQFRGNAMVSGKTNLKRKITLLPCVVGKGLMPVTCKSILFK